MSAGTGSVAIERRPDGVAFSVHVTPRARADGVGPAHDGALRLRTTAPPLDGRANAACRDLLAAALGVARADVSLDPAARGRRKRVVVAGDAGVLAERVQRLASPAGVG